MRGRVPPGVPWRPYGRGVLGGAVGTAASAPFPPVHGGGGPRVEPGRAEHGCAPAEGARLGGPRGIVRPSRGPRERTPPRGRFGGDSTAKPRARGARNGPPRR